MKAEELVGEPFKGLLDITRILGQSIGSRFDYPIEEIISGKNRNAVRGIITVIRSGKGILIKGEATVQIELTCNRCLVDFIQPVSFSIEEEVLYQNSMVSATSLFDEQDAIFIKDQNMLDLGELIRQYTLINLPMKALCKPDCIGNKEDNNYGSS
jgi:uncharacterized protein